MARKKSISALSQAPGTANSNGGDTTEPRRSSRRNKSATGFPPEDHATTLARETTQGNTVAPKKGAGILSKAKEAEEGKLDSAEVEKEKNMAQDGVNRAIEHLAEMELSLQRATKRQKRKIIESVIPTRRDSQEEHAFKPRPTKNKRASTKGAPQVEPLPTPERDSIESEYEDVEGAGEAAEEGVLAVAEVAERGAARPPPVNSDYLPLPWKGRLGYACLNTYLRNSKPSVFSSRTCRMSSIIDHRHPLQDPTQPEHSVKNRPDRTKKADVVFGQKYVQSLGLANAKDIVKMLRWNDKYGIKFMRLSSEMFPFASHQEHGYKLASFGAEALAEAGKVAAELGHRLTTHPGQFTQLGSPRKEVVTAAVRDLDYHDELLTLLQLPEQQNRDAVMILHMGGVFGDKGATLDRFRENYTKLLSPSIKARLVLENDDVSWSVHDLLPICEELNIPLVLDYHHHNIIFDSSQVREGTKDINEPALMARITATWKRKGITQKMHYSEPCPGAVTPRNRRKHSPRVATLPPCPPDMDLMIEAKDKEQAVFELMRTFKLPGYERLSDLIPHEREDESKPMVKKKKPKVRGKKKTVEDDVGDGSEYDIVDPGREVSAEDFAMGGPLGRVYWPVGMEEWLRPRKRDQKRKVDKLDGDESL